MTVVGGNNKDYHLPPGSYRVKHYSLVRASTELDNSGYKKNVHEIKFVLMFI